MLGSIASEIAQRAKSAEEYLGDCPNFVAYNTFLLDVLARANVIIVSPESAPTKLLLLELEWDRAEPNFYSNAIHDVEYGPGATRHKRDKRGFMQDLFVRNNREMHTQFNEWNRLIALALSEIESEGLTEPLPEEPPPVHGLLYNDTDLVVTEPSLPIVQETSYTGWIIAGLLTAGLGSLLWFRRRK